MRIAALIVAAGKGSRAGDGPPKQFRKVGGAAILARTVARFRAARRVDQIALVHSPEHRDLLEAALPDRDDLLLVEGGAERAASARRGLEALADDPFGPPDRVLIHDAARPFVSLRVIDDVIDALDDHDGAVAAVPIVDALWRAGDGLCVETIPREDLWRAQTPQGFRFSALLAAHRAAGDDFAADDAAIARRAGLSVALVESEAENFKITRPGDFARAERQARRDMETRVGTGFDVHAFGEGEHVTLCGVGIAHDRGFVAHSDGDVAWHALTDAILGALALGDIGRWFPPSDARWKGASSDRFLAHAAGLATERGFRISNVDVTIMCERPKIGPRAAEMRAETARVLGLDIERVSVKATTTERLGFTGRGEGVAAQAVATLTGDAS